MIKTNPLSVAAAAASFLLSGSPCAETVNETADLLNNRKTAAYIHSEPMFKIMHRLGIEQDKKYGLQQDCKTPYQVKPFSTSVFVPIEFPDDKSNPVKGIWQLRYQLERCGESKFYNALFIANPNGEAPAPRAYYPGSTNAGPVLIKDAMMGALTSAIVQSGTASRECKDIDVFDMKVTEPSHDVAEGDKTLKNVWKEKWTFRLCGQMVDSEMTFIPSPNGGTRYVVGPANAGSAPNRPAR